MLMDRDELILTARSPRQTLGLILLFHRPLDVIDIQTGARMQTQVPSSSGNFMACAGKNRNT